MPTGAATAMLRCRLVAVADCFNTSVLSTPGVDAVLFSFLSFRSPWIRFFAPLSRSILSRYLSQVPSPQITVTSFEPSINACPSSSFPRVFFPPQLSSPQASASHPCSYCAYLLTRLVHLHLPILASTRLFRFWLC